MDIEKIKVTTENGQTLEVVVLNKRAEHIEVVLGEGPHSVKCSLSPTRNGLAYAGSVMGRELVSARSRPPGHDRDRLNPTCANPKPAAKLPHNKRASHPSTGVWD
jgi:hypothetical protein